MDSNTHSTEGPGGQGTGPAERWASLVAGAQELAAEDLDGLADAALAEDMVWLQWLVDSLEGQWLRRLAAVDARGAAGAEEGQEVRSTASWLRNRLRLSTGAARSAVRTARALFRGSLPETAAALCAGQISLAHAKVVADGTQDLPDHVQLESEPVLLEAARRLDPPQLRRLVGHLCQVADPDSADRARDHRHERRGLWLSPTWDGMIAVDGLLEPEAGTIVQAALEPLAHPADANDTRRGASGPLMPSPSWHGGPWRVDACPRPVGSGPSCWSPWTWTACWATPVAWVGIWGGRDPWTRRRVGDWPVMGQ